MRSRDAHPRSYFPLWTLDTPQPLGKCPPLLSFASPGGVRNRTGSPPSPWRGALGPAPVCPVSSRPPESDNGSHRWRAEREEEPREEEPRVPGSVCERPAPGAGLRIPRGDSGPDSGCGLDRQTTFLEHWRVIVRSPSPAPPSERSKTAEPPRTLCEDLTVL